MDPSAPHSPPSTQLVPVQPCPHSWRNFAGAISSKTRQLPVRCASACAWALGLTRIAYHHQLFDRSRAIRQSHPFPNRHHRRGLRLMQVTDPCVAFVRHFSYAPPVEYFYSLSRRTPSLAQTDIARHFLSAATSQSAALVCCKRPIFFSRCV